MLVLSCEQGSKLQIGDDIVVTVAKIKGDQVKVGIEAPKEQKVLRLDKDGNVQTGGAERKGTIDYSKYHEFLISAELKDYVQNYMVRSFYPCFISSGKNRNGEHTVLTTCSEEVFHKIKDRAFCEKYNAEHPGYFVVTVSEHQDILFMAELKKTMGDRMLLIYDPDNELLNM